MTTPTTAAFTVLKFTNDVTGRIRGAVFTAETAEDRATIVRLLTPHGHKIAQFEAPRCAPGIANELEINTALAVADAHGEGRPVAFRTIALEGESVAVWVLIGTGNGRGYVVAWHASHGLDASKLVGCSGGDRQGRYALGYKTLRSIEPCEGATIVQDWTSV